MATDRTIKPLGGGDFTTAAGWWAFAGGEANADQHGECFSGGDIGRVTISTPVFTPTQAIFPRLYTNLSERHNGSKSATGAFMTNTVATACINVLVVPHIHIEGIRLQMQTGSLMGISLTDSFGGFIEANNLIIENAIGIRGGLQARVLDDIFAADEESHMIRNNIIYGNGLGADAGNVSAAIFCVVAASLTASEGGFTVLNNTFHDWGGRDTVSYGIIADENSVGETATLNITVQGNIVTDSVTADYFNTIVNGVATGGGNISSDATANAFGGANDINITAVSEYVDVINNVALLATATAIDNAITQPTFSSDAIHIAGWRPQGASWDSGALERTGGAAAATLIRLLGEGIIPVP